MNEMRSTIHRRAFLASMAAAGAALMSPNPARGAAAPKRNIALGMDNFSVRAMNWKAPQLIDYAARLNLDVLMISDLDAYESLEEDYLKKVKQQADAQGILIHAGTGGVCPTSPRFIAKYGTAEEHLALLIRTAQTLGSPVARCYLGTAEDRKGDGGIYRHIESTVEVFKKVKSRAVDANVKIAIENHAGDMQAWELAELIEAAGKDYVGATLDCGNAVWALESPMGNLEILGPYAVSSGMRDCGIWESDNGVFVEWTNMGDGHIDWNAYLDIFTKLCPGVPFVLEIISWIGPRNYPCLEVDFWEPYPKARAKDFARFMAMAKKGQALPPDPQRPTGPRSNELNQQQQLYDLERSVQFCKDVLGLGLK